MALRFSSKPPRRFGPQSFKTWGIVVANLVLCNAVLATQTWPATTAVYVGRHFEVRDHDEPVKYVFNGGTRVARSTGSLVVTQRLQRFRLHTGWNLLSLAVSATNALYQITNSSAELTPETVFWWDPSVASWVSISSAQTLAAGTILWCKAGADAFLTLAGSYEDPVAQTIDSVGRYLPGAGFQVWDLGSTLSNLPSTTAWSYDGSLGRWLAWLTAPLQAESDPSPVVAPGSALFARATMAATLPVPEPASGILYYHQDHLCSSSVVTDGHGVLVEETSYHPFGSRRYQDQVRAAIEPYEYSQKERDWESSFHYFEARYLGSLSSRFLSADRKYATADSLTKTELATFLANPQSVNLYAYVRNNPMSYTDPSGEDASKPEGQPAADEPRMVTTLTLTDGHGEELRTDVSSLNWKPGLVGPPLGSGSPKPNDQPRDFTITRDMDKTSVDFYKAATRGDTMNGTITVTRVAKGRSEVVMKITLTGVVVTSVQLGHGRDAPVESIGLNAKSTTFERLAPTGATAPTDRTRPDSDSILKAWERASGPPQNFGDMLWRLSVGPPPQRSPSTGLAIPNP
jgi:RHS repeat-associated protein